LVSEYIDKLHGVYFETFVDDTLTEVKALKYDLFSNMKEEYLKYSDDKFQLDMILVEMGDESKYNPYFR
jgi:hypothetical protein